MEQSEIKLFEGKNIRYVWDEQKEQYFFSVVDIIQVLTDSNIPRRYWSDLKRKLAAEGSEVYEKIVQLKLPSPDGKMRFTDVATTEQLLRLIQSVPSKKAEPFKLWLAEVGRLLDIGRLRLLDIGERRKTRIKKSQKKVLSAIFCLWACGLRGLIPFGNVVRNVRFPKEIRAVSLMVYSDGAWCMVYGV